VSGASERVHLRGLGSYFRRRAGWWIAYHVNGRQFRDSVAKRLGKPPQETTRADAERCLRAAVSRVTQISPPRVIENSLPAEFHSVASAGRTRPAFSLSLSR
jgi:hypothetical protein